MDAVSLTALYPRGAQLFSEGELPRGVFILCRGRARLLLAARNGRSLMRIAEAGAVLGLSAVLTGQPHESSAEMLEAGQINFIRRDQFLSLLQSSVEASLHVAHQLSSDYISANEQARSLGLSESVAAKLAGLLLNWCKQNGRITTEGIHLKLDLTHGDIAQMIDFSRDTVTRLLAELKRSEIIHVNGSNLVVRNKRALEESV